MIKDGIKVLMIMEQCNPEWSSVPLLAYHFYNEIRKRAHVTLVTHERNSTALEKVRQRHDIRYIQESRGLKKYYRWVSGVTSRGGVNWPLQHALSYPVYREFNQKVFEEFGDSVARGDYDIVHAMTPVLPRYPVKIIEKCGRTPFLLGPVNGGVPFPRGDGFADIAGKEFAMFNFLRMFTRLIPGYDTTYRCADLVLSGSTYTMGFIRKRFEVAPDADSVRLFHENGISSAFLQASDSGEEDVSPDAVSESGGGKPLHLLFVGRLVAYKGADILIEALARLSRKKDGADKWVLTIAGDGPERRNLERLAARYELQKQITFTGWIRQEETLAHYQKADLFCFPSIREFGGAVALEAMACGLPCIVPDYAGLGEYVTDACGCKIKPLSRDYLVEQFADKIAGFMEKPALLKKMSHHAVARVKSYEWGEKAKQMIQIYEELISEK